ncbi:VOC family protein [Hyalangium minutum]|uniref:Putative hydroxylase n=1 Tax=Hyalangium minutum TaxID=394096 RepID=A0A085WUP2_9BACT|nr:VOC family protein [Hyalangium minutum]KFE71405.1 putative hydroxylase [Hyalangium minutum]
MAARKGRFDWFDLMTPDVAAARSFYTAVIGWKTTKWEQADYEMWTVGNETIGGMMALPAEETKRGTPPHWLAHIETDDVDATVKKAQELGGKVLRPGTDIPTVGRFAILADPQGAIFGVFRPQEPMNDAPRKPGYFTWHELNTTDYQGAWKFYSELFGWKHTRSMDMGPEMGAYWMFGYDAQTSLGGMSNVAVQMKVPAHWLYYVSVEDLDAALARVKQLGGQILNGPMEVPGGDRIAQCMDPQGGMFALHMSPQS